MSDAFGGAQLEEPMTLLVSVPSTMACLSGSSSYSRGAKYMSSGLCNISDGKPSQRSGRGNNLSIMKAKAPSNVQKKLHCDFGRRASGPRSRCAYSEHATRPARRCPRLRARGSGMPKNKYTLVASGGCHEPAAVFAFTFARPNPKIMEAHARQAALDGA